MLKHASKAKTVCRTCNWELDDIDVDEMALKLGGME
jgi:hypothetical protein